MVRDWAAVIDAFNRDLPAEVSDQQVIWTGARALWHGHESPPGEDFFVQVQDHMIESVLGAAWPRCPHHGTHPLNPGDDKWVCPAVHSPTTTADGRWAFGTLADHPVPAEPHRPDGTVRWYLDARGWGVIAHSEGDLFVHFSSIVGTGYRSLTEGQRVSFTVRQAGSRGIAMQGRLRQARNVELI